MIDPYRDCRDNIIRDQARRIVKYEAMLRKRRLNIPAWYMIGVLLATLFSALVGRSVGYRYGMEHAIKDPPAANLSGGMQLDHVSIEVGGQQLRINHFDSKDPESMEMETSPDCNGHRSFFTGAGQPSERWWKEAGGPASLRLVQGGGLTLQ